MFKKSHRNQDKLDKYRCGGGAAGQSVHLACGRLSFRIPAATDETFGNRFKCHGFSETVIINGCPVSQ